MTIVFLDFDGVIATPESYSLAAQMEEEKPFGVLDPELCGNVQKLCSKFDASIVLCTAWRLMFPMELIVEHLQAKGITAPIIGKTREWPFGRTLKMSDRAPINERGLEIQDWVQRAKELPMFFRYVILDDDNVKPLQNFAVRTTFLDGFTESHISTAIQILERQTLNYEGEVDHDPK